MTYLDRTLEFNNAAESIRLKQNVTKPVKRAPTQQKSEFSITTAKIGKELYDTSDKLAKLTKLTKKVGFVFDDPTVEIEELTFIIKQNIHNLNKEIALLKASTKSSTNSSKQHQSHSDTIITSLNKKLATTTKDFTDVLHQRTETIKTQQDRLSKFTGNLSSALTPTKPATGVIYKSSLENLPESPQRQHGDVVVMMPQMQIVQADDYTSQRAVAVENIERTITELGGIFQQLAAIVAEQGDTLQRIDENIDNSVTHVERGHEALLKVLHNVSSSRMLIVKLFLVLIVFAVIFIVFFL